MGHKHNLLADAVFSISESCSIIQVGNRFGVNKLDTNKAPECKYTAVRTMCSLFTWLAEDGNGKDTMFISAIDNQGNEVIGPTEISLLDYLSSMELIRESIELIRLLSKEDREKLKETGVPSKQFSVHANNTRIPLVCRIEKENNFTLISLYNGRFSTYVNNLHHLVLNHKDMSWELESYKEHKSSYSCSIMDGYIRIINYNIDETTLINTITGEKISGLPGDLIRMRENNYGLTNKAPIRRVLSIIFGRHKDYMLDNQTKWSKAIETIRIIRRHKGKFIHIPPATDMNSSISLIDDWYTDPASYKDAQTC